MEKKVYMEHKLIMIHIAASFVVWSFFIYLLFSHGYKQQYSPVMLGILSMSFSGIMALFNGLVPGFMTKNNSKSILIFGIFLSIVSIGILALANSFGLVIIATILEAISYSITITAINSIGKHVESRFRSEFIFKLFRVIGPVLGGVFVGFMSNHILFIIVAVEVAALVIGFLIYNNCKDNSENIEKQEFQYISTDRYEKNDIYTNILLMLVVIVTFGIQVIDAQLITVLRQTQYFDSMVLGLCIGGSGIGVFLISIFLERYMTKEKYFFVALLGMGLLLIIAGKYLNSKDTYWIVPLLIMFFAGGILWQTIMSVLENIIKSYHNMVQRNKKFTLVGLILIVSYSLGAFFSGFMVKFWGVGNVYIILGFMMLFALLIGFLAKNIIFRKVL